MARRGFLAAAASGGAALLAGCGGDGDDVGDGDTTPDDGNDDAAMDGGDGDPASTPDSEDNGGAETPADGGGGSGSVAMSEVLTLEDSFAIDAETTSEGQRMTFSGRFAGGNMYLDVSQGDQSLEMYAIDGTSYLVSGGQCFTGGSDGISQEEVDPESWSVTGSSETQVTATGTTTIDGTEVYVFELTSAQAPQASAATYYVETGSGHLRRVEAGGSTFNYHSWGEVEAIQKPDMECQSMPDGGGGSGN